MTERVLITGGAGFIGSHTTDALLEAGYAVRILDSLDPQVHGPEGRRPEYLSPEAELVVGDVRDADTLARALEGVDFVYHMAALTGVTQSMHDVRRYLTLGIGTATLWDVLVNRKNRAQGGAVLIAGVYGEAPTAATIAGPRAPAARRHNRRRDQIARPVVGSSPRHPRRTTPDPLRLCPLKRLQEDL